MKNSIRRYRFVWAVTTLLYAHASVARNKPRDYTVDFKKSTGLHQGIKNFFISVMRDATAINYNLINWDTYKTFVTIFPFYGIARLADERLQSCFYERKHHHNVNQLNETWKGIAQKGFVFPVFFAGALSIAARDRDLLKTSRVFLIGFPFIMIAEGIIKECDQISRSGLRPWNQFFSREKRARGGLPSGHMALATYAAMLYGLRFGPKYAVPLGAYAALTAVSFLNCNRHYASQLIAGAGLGIVYAFASSKWVDTKLATTISDRVCVSGSLDARGAPAIKLALEF